MSEKLIERARHAFASYKPQTANLNSLRPAAVLLLLYQKDGEPHVVLIERAQNVENHKGQIAFPGGSREEIDGDLRATAIRETYEELGVQPEHMEIIGQLDDLVTGTNFRITPFVGVVGAPAPYPFLPAPAEVAAVLEIPLARLRDEASFEIEMREWQGRTVPVGAFNWGGYHIWGATARILRQFLDILDGDGE